MNTRFPKVLVIGQPFNKTSGGGITISSLFKNWPREKIALATIPHKLNKNDSDICNNVYCLGVGELTIRFPFGLIFKNQPSGSYHRNFEGDKQKLNNWNFNSLFSSVIYRLLLKITFLFDLNFLFFRIKSSKDFLSFIQEFRPDIIYSQLGHLEYVLFMEELYYQIDIPFAIHIMDDWPDHSAQGIFKEYWKKRLNNGFRNLISKSSLLLSISESMSKEYLERYGKNFIPFHNPIEHVEKKLLIKQTSHKNKYTIIYTGRIGFSNKNGILDISRSISSLRKDNYDISLVIYSPDSDKALGKNIVKIEGIIIEKPIEHSKIMSVLQSADLLFLPLDFDAKSIGYAKLSMPTKATEYMISGTPILLYAPVEMGVTISAQANGWAKVVSKRSIKELSNAIIDLLNNEKEYLILSESSYKFAIENFEAEKVREKFRSALVKVLK